MPRYHCGVEIKEYNSGGYQCSTKGYDHRNVYEEHLHKAIPAGMEIHHIDRNSINNHIDNLIMLPKTFHQWFHKNWELIDQPDTRRVVTTYLNRFNQLRKMGLTVSQLQSISFKEFCVFGAKRPFTDRPRMGPNARKVNR